ncbi:imidazole glycerol phosphate synthase subunit HisH [Buchnera aphidicola]|uniref:Imidazole glycerol phosphate synthase subunit HisH n=1 Tax=Buchnera aphidicola (Sarucallis kahawaluokalani) TaxID=1241878 RepID=A0A4D6Y944_9GAMM|nr:imidazole glycerol phosphate synthase subunit HisH [Buchnera aphidicola]QCI25879.1 imidazole glycerol phosphate synthase subunit HisH [Buchnera aphidicola (Sarucallis kahawaluokalani)]
MSIIILDTNCSNLLSIKLSIEKLGYNPVITTDVHIIQRAKKIFIPGVGSASEIMKQFSKNNLLINTLKNVTCPTLGICLGMQVMSSFSDESGGIDMLGIIDTPVVLLQSGMFPLPHTGWNQVFFNKYHPLFHNIKSGEWFYFLHSYVFSINQYTVAHTTYNTIFSSVIQKNNFFGVQFHPEKSGVIGSKLLLNFLEM